MPLPPNTLNQALDQLPQLLLTLGKLQQDRRDEELRRDIQQASQAFQRDMLEKRIAAERELTQFKAGLETPKDPPEARIVGGRIEKDLTTLRDPNIESDFGKKEINTIKSRVKGDVARYEQLTGRSYPVDPALLAEQPGIKPPPLAAPPKPEREFPPTRLGETEAGFRRRIEPELGPSITRGEPFVGAEAPPMEGQPVKIATDDEYEALPGGTVFAGPDGIPRTKPSEDRATPAAVGDSVTVPIGGDITITVPRIATPESRARIKQARAEYRAGREEEELAERREIKAREKESQRVGDLARRYKAFLAETGDPHKSYERFGDIINQIAPLSVRETPETKTTRGTIRGFTIQEAWEAIEEAEDYRTGIIWRASFEGKKKPLKREKIKRFQ